MSSVFSKVRSSSTSRRSSPSPAQFWSKTSPRCSGGSPRAPCSTALTRCHSAGVIRGAPCSASGAATSAPWPTRARSSPWRSPEPRPLLRWSNRRRIAVRSAPRAVRPAGSTLPARDPGRSGLPDSDPPPRRPGTRSLPPADRCAWPHCAGRHSPATRAASSAPPGPEPAPGSASPPAAGPQAADTPHAPPRSVAACAPRARHACSRLPGAASRHRPRASSRRAPRDYRCRAEKAALGMRGSFSTIVSNLPAAHNSGGSNKQIGPNVEELRQVLRLLFTDGSFAAQNLGNTSLRPDDRPQVGWLQRALFEEKSHHVAGRGLLPRRICRRLIVADRVREEIEERVFLGRHAMLTFLYQGFHNRKSPLVLHFRSDHARRRFRQQAAITLQVDGFGHLPSVVQLRSLPVLWGRQFCLQPPYRRLLRGIWESSMPASAG